LGDAGSMSLATAMLGTAYHRRSGRRPGT
jgi:hypothetical protein